MQEQIKILKLWIRNFRGYKEERYFDLSLGEDIAVLCGSNGFGKTSFFEALEWGFTGALFRYSEANDERNTTCFINYMPYEQPAKVVVEFGNDLVNYILTREAKSLEHRSTDYGQDKTTLTLKGTGIEKSLTGTEACEFLNKIMIKEEWQSKIKFEDVFSKYHLLTQDKIKHFIQHCNGRERHTQVTSLVGTERFKKYDENFEMLKNKVEEEKESLSAELLCLGRKGEELKSRLIDTSSYNLGEYENADEFLTYLIEKYNASMAKMELDMFCDETGMLLFDRVKGFKEHIFAQKENIYKLEKEYGSEKEKLQLLTIGKDQYRKNCITAEKITHALNVLDRYEIQKYLHDNLDDYSRYYEFKEECQIKVKTLEHELYQLERFHTKLRAAYNAFDPLLKILKEASTGDAVEPEIYIHRIFERIKAFTCDLNIGQERIHIYKMEDSNIMALSDYEIKIESEYDREFFLDEHVAYIMEQAQEFAWGALETVRQCDQDKNHVGFAIIKLEKEINSLCSLDEEHKRILENAASFIKANMKEEEDETRCPVCSTKFEAREIIDKIESQLHQENLLIMDKIEEKEVLYDRHKNIQNEADRILQKFTVFLENFIKDLQWVQSNIARLAEYFIERQTAIHRQIDDIGLKIANLDRSYQSYTGLVDKLNLSADRNALSYELEAGIMAMDHRAEDNEIEVNGFNRYEQEGLLKKVTGEIQLFEQSIREAGIDTESLEESLAGQITRVESIAELLYSEKSNVELVEQHVLSIFNLITNDQVQEELRELEALKKKKECEYEEKTTISDNIDLMRKSIQKAIGNINEKIMKDHEDFINAIFNRIYPHPFFRNIQFVFDENKFKNGVLRIMCRQGDAISINPAYTFSSAQVNIVAISIFLAIVLRQQCTNLSTILLDDPVQNMDDVNILSLIDILRSSLSEGALDRQLILSTHDEKIYRLMMKKFRFFKTRAFKFSDYNCNGPVFEVIDMVKNTKKY